MDQTSKQYFKSMQIVHMALVLGVTSFTIIAFFLNYKGQFSSDDGYITHIFHIVTPILFACCIIASIMIHKLGLKKIKLKNTLSDKLEAYRALFIKRFALLEAAAFFAIVVFMVTSNIIFMSYAAFIIILFVLFRPTKEKIIMELELEPKDRELVDNPDAIVARYTTN